MYLSSFVSSISIRLRTGEWTSIGERREFVVLGVFEGEDLIVARGWDGAEEFWVLFDAHWTGVVEEMVTVAGDIVKGVNVDTMGLGSGYDWAKFDALVRSSKWTLRSVEPVLYVDRVVVTGLGGTANVDEQVVKPWQKQAVSYFDNFPLDLRLKETKSGSVHDPVSNGAKTKVASFVYEEDIDHSDESEKQTNQPMVMPEKQREETNRPQNNKKPSYRPQKETKFKESESGKEESKECEGANHSPVSIDHPFSRTIVYNNNQVRLTSRKRRQGNSTNG